MTKIPSESVIITDRLRMVPFDQPHASALNTLDNEPQVMEFLSEGKPKTLAQTKAGIKRARKFWEKLGFGWWTIFHQDQGDIIGSACLQHIANVPGTELEIGWRLTASAAGHGYATEAGKAAARYAFDVVGVDHVVATADQANIASHRVMQRIGMTYRGIETHYDAPCTTYVLHETDPMG